MALFIVFVLLVFLYSLVSQWLDRTVATPPIVFTVAGILVVLLGPPAGGAEGHGPRDLLLHLAEIGLVLLLFCDASGTRLAALRDIRSLATRLLSTGMLLTILLGTLCALVVLPGLTVWEAAILGAILAPTDAGLGQVIVSSPRVPARIREALNPDNAVGFLFKSLGY